MLFQSATAVALLASFAAAQTTTTNTTVNIGALDLTLKGNWCQGQISACGYLCSGATVSGENTCVEETLAYECNCQSNGSAPGLQYYENTIPSYLCQQQFSDCNAANVGNKAGQDRCAAARTANCGTLKADDFEAVPASTTSSAGSSSTGNPTSSAASVASNVASTTSSQAGAMPTMAATFGSGVVAAGMAAAFGLLL